MNILKIKLSIIIFFISNFLLAQGFFESEIRPDSTENTYGMFITNGEKECFVGYEYHVDHGHGENNHHRIAMRASNIPGSNGVFIGETGQLAVGTNDPCARLVDPTTMLSVEGRALKVQGGSMWDEPTGANLMKNITPLENSAEKFMKVKFYSYERKSASGIQYGVIGEEIKEAFPNSVKSLKQHDEEYHYFNANNLFYTGMKVIQENSKEIIKQDQKIRNLEAENQDLKNHLAAQQKDIEAIRTALADLGVDLPQNNASEVPTKPVNTSIHIEIKGNHPRLEQNIPNPFSKFTTIPYHLPDDTQTATLIIRDMTGKTIAKHILPTQKGAGKIDVDIEDTELGGGTFTYSLYINETLIDTKKMVLLSK